MFLIEGHQLGVKRSTHYRRIVTTCAAIIAVAGITAGVSFYNRSAGRTGPLPVHLPTTPQSYLGLYTNDAPASYRGVKAFAQATGTRPDVVMYYSGWFEPFRTSFATDGGRERRGAARADGSGNRASASPRSRPESTTAT